MGSCVVGGTRGEEQPCDVSQTSHIDEDQQPGLCQRCGSPPLPWLQCDPQRRWKVEREIPQPVLVLKKKERCGFFKASLPYFLQ